MLSLPYLRLSEAGNLRQEHDSNSRDAAWDDRRSLLELISGRTKLTSAQRLVIILLGAVFGVAGIEGVVVIFIMLTAPEWQDAPLWIAYVLAVVSPVIMVLGCSLVLRGILHPWILRRHRKRARYLSLS